MEESERLGTKLHLVDQDVHVGFVAQASMFRPMLRATCATVTTLIAE